MDFANVPAYMAIRFKGIDENGGWVPTGSNLNSNALPAGKTGGPPDRKSWAPLRSFEHKITRDFEGINSSGGPQTAVRADHSDLSVERNTDAISPLLFEYCCTGKQLAAIHLVRLRQFAGSTDVTVSLYLVLEDVQVTGYEFEATRSWWDLRSNTTIGGVTGADWSTNARGTTHVDRMKFLYTKLRVVQVNVPQSQPLQRVTTDWDTGTDSRIGS